MHGETSFRIALVVVILITIAIGIPHRMKAAASGEVISHKEEGLLFAATLRIAGLLLWLSTFAYLVFPASISWASIPLPMGNTVARRDCRHRFYIPVLLDAFESGKEPDRYGGNSQRRSAGDPWPLSLGSPSVLCLCGILDGVRYRANGELAHWHQ
jgi:hypothetical protein